MDTSTIIVIGLAVLFGVIWLLKRRARIRGEHFE